MNANAKKWIKALRSGKYQQVSGALARLEKYIGDKEPETHYCCLGVACDLAIKAGINVRVKEEDSNLHFSNQKYFLPRSVRDWLGLKTERGHFMRNGYGADLASMNDEGASFRQIARIVEGEPEGLFRAVKKKAAKKKAVKKNGRAA